MKSFFFNIHHLTEYRRDMHYAQVSELVRLCITFKNCEITVTILVID